MDVNEWFSSAFPGVLLGIFLFCERLEMIRTPRSRNGWSHFDPCRVLENRRGSVPNSSVRQKGDLVRIDEITRIFLHYRIASMVGNKYTGCGSAFNNIAYPHYRVVVSLGESFEAISFPGKTLCGSLRRHALVSRRPSRRLLLRCGNRTLEPAGIGRVWFPCSPNPRPHRRFP